MLRTIISMEKQDKLWLDEQAKQEKVTMAEIIRRAIKQYRKDVEQVDTMKDFDTLLNKTKGVWKQGDGLAYQCKIREEWD